MSGPKSSRRCWNRRRLQRARTLFIVPPGTAGPPGAQHQWGASPVAWVVRWVVQSLLRAPRPEAPAAVAVAGLPEAAAGVEEAEAGSVRANAPESFGCWPVWFQIPSEIVPDFRRVLQLQPGLDRTFFIIRYVHQFEGKVFNLGLMQNKRGLDFIAAHRVFEVNKDLVAAFLLVG